MIKSRLWRLLTLKANCGVLRPAPRVTFVSAKVTKTPPPGARDPILRSSLHRARSPNSPGAYYAPRARTRSRLKAPGGAAVLGARYGDPKNQAICAP